VDRSKLRVIDPAEGNRIDYYMGLINDLFLKGELNAGHTARRMHLGGRHRDYRNVEKTLWSVC
jgi:hypothetical protein